MKWSYVFFSLKYNCTYSFSQKIKLSAFFQFVFLSVVLNCWGKLLLFIYFICTWKALKFRGFSYDQVHCRCNVQYVRKILLLQSLYYQKVFYNNDNKFGAFRPTLIYSLDNSDSWYCFPFFVQCSGTHEDVKFKFPNMGNNL